MCIRDSGSEGGLDRVRRAQVDPVLGRVVVEREEHVEVVAAVSYTHLRAHETVLDLVCRLLLEKKTEA